MTNSHIWRDSFTYLTWLIHMFDVTYLHIWRASFAHMTWLMHTHVFQSQYNQDPKLMWLIAVWCDSPMYKTCDSFAHVTRLTHIYTYICVPVTARSESTTTRRTHIHHINVTWLIHIHEVPYYIHVSIFTIIFIYIYVHLYTSIHTHIYTHVTWIIHICEATHSYRVAKTHRIP